MRASKAVPGTVKHKPLKSAADESAIVQQLREHEAAPLRRSALRATASAPSLPPPDDIFAGDSVDSAEWSDATGDSDEEAAAAAAAFANPLSGKAQCLCSCAALLNVG